MVYIIAGLMAALSYVLNRLALKIFGMASVVTFSPIVEESAKTLLAYFLAADIVYTHIIFGIIEACRDLYTSPKHGMAAACFSIAGHTIFGVITVTALRYSGEILAGLGCGILIHLCWNLMAIRRLN